VSLAQQAERTPPAICVKAANTGNVNVRLVRKFGFESAHRLPHVPQGHKCSRLHGHSFRVEVAVSGPVDPELGWFIDYAEIDAACRPLVEVLDHRYLNEIEGLENPTSERLAKFIWDRLVVSLRGLERVTVMETCESRCEYEGR
jgi:6-pyruvoyltetrahydropterin/6-carboxytetrahydropterin synthase